MSNRPMLVYLLTNKMTDKKYVGITGQLLSARWQRHRMDARTGFKSYLCRALRKYGPENFSLEVIATASNRADLQKLEIEYIEKLNTRSPNGYNMTIGGDGRHEPHSDETRKKMSEAHRRRMADPELRAHLSQKMREYAQNNPTEMSRRSRCNNGPMTERELAAYEKKRQLQTARRASHGT